MQGHRRGDPAGVSVKREAGRKPDQMMDVDKVGPRPIQKGREKGLDARILVSVGETSGSFEIVHHPHDMDPLGLLFKDFIIGPIEIALAAENPYLMAAPSHGAGDLIDRDLHTP